MVSHIVEKIDILSFAKLNAVFGLIFGLVMGIVTLVITSLVSGFLQTPSVNAALTTQNYVAYNPQLIVQIQQLGFLGLIMFLIAGVIVGFIVGAIIAFVYNLASKLVGGVAIELRE